MCRLELRSTHILYIFVTFQPGKFSKLGEMYHLELRTTHIIYIFVTFQIDRFSKLVLGRNMSFGIKRYSDLASQAVIFGNYREKANFFIKITPQIYTILGRIIQNVIYTSICSFVIAFLITICVGTSITRAGGCKRSVS